MNQTALVLTVDLNQVWRGCFLKHGAQLFENYRHIVLLFSPRSNLKLFDFLPVFPGLHFTAVGSDASNWRLEALCFALQASDALAFHYCDGNHALSRFALDPQAWQAEALRVSQSDVLIIARTAQAFQSYPAPLRVTETWVNAIASQWLEQNTDIGSGARGFSRSAAQAICKLANPGIHSIASDLEWPLLLKLVGFQVQTYFSPTAYYGVQDEAKARRLASPAQWELRYEIARTIIHAGMRTLKRTDLPTRESKLSGSSSPPLKS